MGTQSLAQLGAADPHHPSAQRFASAAVARHQSVAHARQRPIGVQLVRGEVGIVELGKDDCG